MIVELNMLKSAELNGVDVLDDVRRLCDQSTVLLPTARQWGCPTYSQMATAAAKSENAQTRCADSACPVDDLHFLTTSLSLAAAPRERSGSSTLEGWDAGGLSEKT